MMLLAKTCFQISTNVPEEEIKKYGVKGRIDHFNSIFEKVIDKMPNDLDVTIYNEHPSIRKYANKISEKKFTTARIVWYGCGKEEEDIRKFVELWNETEGPKVPVYFMKMNTDPFYTALHEYTSHKSHIFRTKVEAEAVEK